MHTAHLKCAAPNNGPFSGECPACASANAIINAAEANDAPARDRLTAGPSTTQVGYRAAKMCNRAVGSPVGVRDLLTRSPVSIATMYALPDSTRAAMGAGSKLECLRRATIKLLSEIEEEANAERSEAGASSGLPAALQCKARAVIAQGRNVKDPALYFEPVKFLLPPERAYQQGKVSSAEFRAATAKAAAVLTETHALLSLAIIQEATPADIADNGLLTFSAIAGVVRRNAAAIFSAPSQRSPPSPLAASLNAPAWTVTSVIEAGLVTSWDQLSCLNGIGPYLRTHGAALASIGVTYTHIRSAFANMRSWTKFATLLLTPDDLAHLQLTVDVVVDDVIANHGCAEFGVFRYLTAGGLDRWGVTIDHIRKIVTSQGTVRASADEKAVNKAITQYLVHAEGLGMSRADVNDYFFE